MLCACVHLQINRLAAIIQVPDFQKLHLDEELRLQAIKEQNKQHLTQPKEFRFGSVHHRDHAGKLLGFAWCFSNIQSLHGDILIKVVPKIRSVLR